MKLTLVTIYIWPLTPLSYGYLKLILSEHPDAIADLDRLARILGWNRATVKAILAHPSLPDIDGPVLLSMNFEDLQGLSWLRAVQRIECAIVAAVSALWPLHFLARMFDRTEDQMRRIQKKAIVLGLLAQGYLKRVRTVVTRKERRCSNSGNRQQNEIDPNVAFDQALSKPRKRRGPSFRSMASNQHRLRTI
jgi:hypothetical protein